MHDVKSSRARRSWRHAMVLAAAAAASLLAGCGGMKTYPVHGRVELKGEPDSGRKLADYCVTLESVDVADAQGLKVTGVGFVTPEGTFEVSTFKPGDGAVAGRHRVAVTPPVQMTDGPPLVPLIAPRYGSLENSGLEITVGPDSGGVLLTLELAPKPPARKP